MLAYLVLLSAHHVSAQWWRGRDIDQAGLIEERAESRERWGADLKWIDIPRFVGAGQAGGVAAGDGRTMRLVYRHWEGSGDRVSAGDGAREPVILLHGSPGSSTSFASMGGALAGEGYEVFAPDLPGFGLSARHPPSYSIRAHARSVLELMDREGIERAHIVGFSLGGGVMLEMVRIAREERGGEVGDRFASLVFLASVGAQETEGSGSYWIEHGKYAVMYVLGGVVPELVPHFGLLGDTTLARSARNFWESDQRPLRGVMEGLGQETSVLVLHGRADPLISERSARKHWEMMQGSRLVMTGYSHFMPFLQPGFTAGELARFFRMVERGEAVVGEEDLGPPRPVVFGLAGKLIGDAVRRASPGLMVVLIAWGVVLRPRLTVGVCAVLSADMTVDYGVAYMGLVVGALAWRWRCYSVGRDARRRGAGEPTYWRRRLRREGSWTWFVSELRHDLRDEGAVARGMVGRLGIGSVVAVLGAVVLRVGVGFVPAMVVGGLVAQPPWYPLGGVSALVGVVVAMWVSWACESALTWTGRRRLLAAIGKVRRHEFWPAWVFYVPVGAYIGFLGIREWARGGELLAFTACNPSIGNGGGMVGESKTVAMRELMRVAPGVSARAVVVPGGRDARVRARECVGVVENELGGFPAVLKPDRGYRGFAVRVVRSGDEVEGYFERMRGDVQVQAFAEGPREVGIAWVRLLDGDGGLTNDGRIFSITAKRFPVIEGDGVHDLEWLIFRHPRYRFQADVFLDRVGAERVRVPTAGERVALGFAGNHCQGTLFRDGGELVTEELERAVNEVSLAFGSENGGPGGLDTARLDARYASDEGLARGEGMTIVEVNGTLGESTNIYDPDRSVVWAWGVLCSQWRAMYALGRARVDAGGRAMGLVEMLSAVRRDHAERAGGWVSD